MHRPIVRQLNAACIAAAALTAAVNASAHYYGYVYSPYVSGAGDRGASVILKTNILHQTCNTFVHDFVDHEMWYMTDSSGNYWIEVGFYDGEGTNAIFNPCQNHAPFWSDSRPGGGFNTHFYNNGWNFGTYYQAEITASGSCTWNVILGGVTLGTSTSNCPGSGRKFQAGIETTSQTSGSVQGFATGWQAQDANGNWSPLGWGSILHNHSDYPPTIEQVANSPWGAQTEETLNEPF